MRNSPIVQRVSAHLSIERVVALFTPLFAAAAAWITGVIATIVPGAPPVNTADITALEIAGAAAAIAAAIAWLHGRAFFVRDSQDAEQAIQIAQKRLEEILAANPAAGPALEDIEALLKSHEADSRARSRPICPRRSRQSRRAVRSAQQPAGAGDAGRAVPRHARHPRLRPDAQTTAVQQPPVQQG